MSEESEGFLEFDSIFPIHQNVFLSAEEGLAGVAAREIPSENLAILENTVELTSFRNIFDILLVFARKNSRFPNILSVFHIF